jgi:uncharacterized protein YkwD
MGGMLYPNTQQKNTRTQIAAMILSTLVVAAGIIVPTTHIHTAQAGISVSSISSGALVAMLNDHRKEAGLSELAPNEQLENAAMAKASDMIAHDYFNHWSPSGVSPWHWITQSGYQYSYAGENLAIDFATSNDVDEGWMNSTLHRENMLSTKYSEVGIAVARGVVEGQDTIVVVEMFGTPRTMGAIAKTTTKTVKGTINETVKNVSDTKTSVGAKVAGTKVAGTNITRTNTSDIKTSKNIKAETAKKEIKSSKDTKKSSKKKKLTLSDILSEMFNAMLAYVVETPKA